jgi:hypothetical protein
LTHDIDIVYRRTSWMRRRKATLSLLALCASSCAHSTHVRYQVPLDTAEARICVRFCSKRYPTAPDSYARCLRTCPGAIERERAKCPAAVDETRMACAEHEREEVGLAAIIGSTIAVAALTVLVLLQ